MKKSVKKFISVVCVLATLLASLSMGLVFTGATADTGIWDGRTADSFAEGSGDGSSADNAILIENGAQLYKAIVVDGGAGKYYKLTKNIYMNDTSEANWYTKDGLNNWPVNKGFYGTLDGNGYVIYGLYSVGGEYMGLIPYTVSNQTTTIANLGIERSYYKTTSSGYARMAAFVGSVQNSAKLTMDQCYVGEDVHIVDDYGRVGQGALVGYLACHSSQGAHASIIMTNCYSLAKVTRPSATDTGGLLLGDGWCDDGSSEDSADDNYNSRYAFSFKNCYAVNTNTTCASYFRIVGKSNNRAAHSSFSHAISNLYGTSTNQNDLNVQYKALTSAQMKGNNAITYMTKPRGDSKNEFDWTGIWKAVSGEYPRLRVFLTEEENNIWCGEPVDSYAGGEGTEAKPYLISNGGQLYKAIAIDGGAGKYYKLTNDIQLNDTSANGEQPWYSKEGLFNWPNRKKVTGHFDGAGHVVRGLYSTGDERLGLFPEVNGTMTIKNLGLDDAYISATNYGYAGGLIGLVDEAGNLTVNHCYVGSNVQVHAQSQGLGGMIGWAQSYKMDIQQCYAVASLFTNSTSFNEDNWGALIGSGWVTSGAKLDTKVKFCYAVAQNNPTEVPFCSTRFCDGDYWQVYGSYKPTNAWGNYKKYVNVISEIASFVGVTAKANMSGLDFTSIWVANPGGYPTLQVFDAVSAIGYQQLDTTGTESKPAVRFRFNLNTDATNVTKQEIAEDGTVTSAADFKNATVVANGKEYKIDSIHAVYAYRAAATSDALTLANAESNEGNNKYIKSVEITKLQKAMTDELGRPVFTVRVSVPQSSASQTIIVRPVLKLVDPDTNTTFEIPCGYIEGVAA